MRLFFSDIGILFGFFFHAIKHNNDFFFFFCTKRLYNIIVTHVLTSRRGVFLRLQAVRDNNNHPRLLEPARAIIAVFLPVFNSFRFDLITAKQVYSSKRRATQRNRNEGINSLYYNIIVFCDFTTFLVNVEYRYDFIYAHISVGIV